MVKFNDDLNHIRDEVRELINRVEQDDYLNVIPSIRKKIDSRGFYFHATDDPPEARQLFYKFISGLDCSLEMVVGRKIPAIYTKKHKGHEREFYSDVLSHLLKNKLMTDRTLVLNIASRGSSTSNKNLQAALGKATARAHKKWKGSDLKAKVVFNVQNQINEPLLNVADYLCWSVQRVFEKGETRYYDFIQEKISLVVDLYDSDNYQGRKNYYRRNNPLTEKNKVSPPSP